MQIVLESRDANGMQVRNHELSPLNLGNLPWITSLQ